MYPLQSTYPLGFDRHGSRAQTTTGGTCPLRFVVLSTRLSMDTAVHREQVGRTPPIYHVADTPGGPLPTGGSDGLNDKRALQRISGSDTRDARMCELREVTNIISGA